MGLFTPKWKTDDRSRQTRAVEAVQKVTNEKELKRIALEAPLPDVRMAAVYRMKDPEQLREMAFSGDRYVSRAAIDNITDPETLKEIACGNGADAGRAAQKISDRDLLAEIARKASNREAKEKAGAQLDFLTLLYEAVRTSGADISRRTEYGTLEGLIGNFDFTDDTYAGKVVPAIISEMTDTGMIDRLVQACGMWRRSKDAAAKSARVRKLELLCNGIDRDQFLVFLCRKCGKTVRYTGYFQRELRDSWVEKGDYRCGCTEHPAAAGGFPVEDGWEPAVSAEPIEGDRFRLCPVCLKPDSPDVHIKPLSRCPLLDGKKDIRHSAVRFRTEYFRPGIYIPWDRAKW